MPEKDERIRGPPKGRHDPPLGTRSADAGGDSRPLTGGPSTAGRRGHELSRQDEGVVERLDGRNEGATPEGRRNLSPSGGGKDAQTARSEELGR